MEQSTAAKILAAIVAIGAFAYGATQGDLISLGAGLGAAAVASIGIYLQPPKSTGWSKLVNHLVLSIPLAGLAVVAKPDLLYSSAAGFQLGNWMAEVLLLMVPASVLEQYYLMKGA